MRTVLRVASVVAAVVVAGPHARATWSIVVTDSATGEVAVGTATCLNPSNIKKIVPIVRVGRGAAAGVSDEAGSAVSLPIGSTIQEAEEKLIRTTLSASGGNKTRAAKILGISLKTMHNKVKKYQL